MTTRYGEEQISGRWDYPTNLPGFLQALGTNETNLHEARSRVNIFMVTPIARKMPPGLRAALISATILDAGTQPHGPGLTRRE